jgi:hypothetical protein
METVHSATALDMRALQIFFVIGLAATCGCSGSSSRYDRVPLEGTATLNGAPFEGSISLRPQPGTSGPVVNATVENGAFAFDEQTGPVSGPHVAFLMPVKMSRDQESVNTVTTVPEKEPFRIDVVINSEPRVKQAVRGTPPNDETRSGK